MLANGGCPLTRSPPAPALGAGRHSPVGYPAGLSAGRRASFVATIGCTLGIVPHLVAALLGLAAVLHASALAFQVVKYPGVAYLLYLAWTTLRDQPALTVIPGATSRSARQVIVSAILVKP